MRSFISSEIRSQLIDSATGKSFEKNIFPPTKNIPDSQRLRILVTGGSGFVGSHLVDRLMMAGHQVTVIDNMFTGRKKNIAQWIGHPNFLLIIHDVVEPIMMEVNYIFLLANLLTLHPLSQQLLKLISIVFITFISLSLRSRVIWD